MALNFLNDSRSNNTEQIHWRALTVAQRYKRCEFELIEILEQVDKFKVFYQYGARSLFKYTTEILGLSSEVAYIFINVCRKTREVPALKEEIRKGTITVSKAKKLSPVINAKNQDFWLNMAKNESARKIEKHVAMASPKHAVREKLEYVTESKEVKDKAKIISVDSIADEARQGLPTSLEKARVQLQVGISENLMLKLRRIQDLVSQKRQKSVSLEEALEVMVNLYIEKQDPIEKAKRQKIKGKLRQDAINLRHDKTKPCNDIVNPHPSDFTNKKVNQRKPIPARVRHQLMMKYNGQCSYVNQEGKRCESKRFLDIHHIRPISHGGTDDLENLMLICSGHHRLLHSLSSMNFIKS